MLPQMQFYLYKEFDMSAKIEQAVDNFENGFNCSRTVLDPYCEQFSLDCKTVFKIAIGFDNGMCMGGVCGVVAAAFMVLGLKHGYFLREPKI